MAHPKSRISKQRKRKRRTHQKATTPPIAFCKATGQPHVYHQAHWHEGNLYYKGKLVIASKDDE